MPSFFTDSLHLRLSGNAITVLKITRWPHAKTVVIANAHLPENLRSHPDRFGEAVSAILEQGKCSRMATYVMLSDDLVRLFIVTPPQNVERFSDCQAAAAMRFQALYDEAPSNWEVAADWDTPHPFLACALPKTLLNTLQKACNKHRLRLIRVQPQFVIAYNRCRKIAGAKAWLGSVQGTTVILGAFDKQRLYAVRQISLPDTVWQDESCLPHCLEREALRLGLPAPKRLHLYGNLPGHWATRKMGELACSRMIDPFFSQDLANTAAATLACAGGPA
jgi:hypothetical protein